MQSIRVPAVTASTAHREWASRPADERFTSVAALRDAARARREGTEERDVETSRLRTEVISDDGLVVRQTSGRTSALSHWSFEQLAAIAGAPPKYLRTLPASIASSAINHGLTENGRAAQRLFTDRDEPWTIRAVTSTKYARVHHDEL